MISLVDLEAGRSIAEGADVIRRSAALLDEGAILVHPTSTVYGIGGRPAPEIDAEIARLKGRPRGQSLIRVAATVAELRSAVPTIRWSSDAERLASRFWPGPLTLVLATTGSDGKDDGEDSVAVRVDPHPILQQILAESGGVMTSTSLNRSGDPPAASRREALSAIERLGPARMKLGFVDVGDLPAARPSTIVDLTGDPARLLREGEIVRTELEPHVRLETGDREGER